MTAILLVMFAIVLGIAVSIAVSLAQLAQLAQLAAVLPTYPSRFATLLDEAAALAQVGVGRDRVRTALSGLDIGAIAELVTSLHLGLANVLSNFVLRLSLLLFTGLGAAGFPDPVRAIGTNRPAIVTALGRFVRGTRSFLVVTSVFGAIVAVLDVGALWIMGVPSALLWALVAFVTNYIPNIGFIIGLVPPAPLTPLQGGWELAALVIIIYCVINFVIQSDIHPKFIGDAVDLSLLSLVFGRG